jgi:hypothetical protein
VLNHFLKGVAMGAAKRSLQLFVVFLILIFAGFIFINYYSYIFSRKVKGVIEKVERVELNVALMQTDGTGRMNPQLYSFAVAIKEPNGEIVTASSEDRQWAVVKEGQCAEAIYYPYPPWKLDKANTYYGARLEKLSDCQKAQ